MGEALGPCVEQQRAASQPPGKLQKSVSLSGKCAHGGHALALRDPHARAAMQLSLRATAVGVSLGLLSGAEVRLRRGHEVSG